MPWSPPLPFRPGVNTVMTPDLVGLGYSKSNLMRFRDGIPEKNGGWSRLSDTTLIGVARGMNVWADLSGLPYAAFGTEQRLEILSNLGISDITPVFLTIDLTPAFVTTMGNVSVEFTDASAPPNLTTGDWILIVVPVAIGGIVLEGLYQITGVTTPGSVFTFDAAVPALSADSGGVVPVYTTTGSSATILVTLTNNGVALDDIWVNQVATAVGTVNLGGYAQFQITNIVDTDNFQFINLTIPGTGAMASENGGNARIQYLLPTGFSTAMPLLGYGVGLYGVGLYGTSGSGATYTQIRQWFMDQWGEDLVCNYPASPIFIWMPPVAPGNFALAINTANFSGATSPPQMVNVSFVAMPQQILMALGCEPSSGGKQDPNLIRWSNVADFTDWVATATNQAGSFRIPTGSHLVGGITGPTFGAVWTDEDMYIFNYLGFPLVFGFNRISGGVGLLAGRCCCVAGGLIYWASSDGIYKFDGSSVSIVPCPVWDTMWRNLNRIQIDKSFMAANAWFNELTLFFPSNSGNDEIDSYIRLNLRENLWDYGPSGTLYAMTCWHDANVLGPPISVNVGKLIQQHETATDADGTQLQEYIQTGYFSIDNGFLFTVINQVVSDIKYEGTNPQLLYWILTKQYPKDTPVVFGPFTDTPTTPEFETINARGRVASIMIGLSSVGAWWRMGWFRYLYQPDGSL